MSELSIRTEIALHLAYNLASSNKVPELFKPFVLFVCHYANDFIADYESASHLRRHSTGHLEKSLVTMLIEMSSYHCSFHNCQTASNIMILLGYESYQLKRNRFRQKVENYLRQMRKEGGRVPPSTRSVMPIRESTVKMGSAIQLPQSTSDVESSKESDDSGHVESTKTDNNLM